MYEVIFLIVLALAWIVFASIQDLRSREVANWLSFSLVIFALGFRFFYSLFSQNNFGFFYQGLIGFGIFFILGNLLYYCRMFAGGDAKLMIALGPVLGFSSSFSSNLKIYLVFLVLFLFAGATYGLVYSLFLALGNFKEFKKDFSKKFKKEGKKIYLVVFLGLVLIGLGFVEDIFLLFGIFIFILPYFYLFAKSVDSVCMVKKTKTRNLTEGDWLFKDIKIGKKLIKASWGGLTKEEIIFIKKKYKIVLIRHGIPFTPAFLISFIVLTWMYFSGNYILFF